MPISTTDDLLRLLEQLRLLTPARQRELIETGIAVAFPDPHLLARELLRRDWLTAFQINQLFRDQGDTLRLGPYVLLDRLAEGGMGAVYKALQSHLERVVALKVIRRERINKPEAISRFQRELRAVGQLQHPNVVTVHDAGEEAGTLFLVMEYVEGTDLAKLIKQRGPLDVREACEYIRQAALGLEHIRQRGLVHRDIKPANLLLDTSAGQPATVKITDLGLARLLSGADGSTTADGSMLGTPDFLAPEQALDSHSVDIRADIYSLGCTLFYLLTGQVPFPGGSLADKLLRHQRGTPTPLADLRPDLPTEVVALTGRMMARKPGKRYQTPDEAARALAEVLETAGEEMSPTLPRAIPLAEPVAESAAPSTSPAVLAPLTLPTLPRAEGASTGREMAAVEQDTSSVGTGNGKAPAASPRSATGTPVPSHVWWGWLWQRRGPAAGAAAGLGVLVLLLVLQPWRDEEKPEDGDTEDEEPNVWRPGKNPVADPFPPRPPVVEGREGWFGLVDKPAPVKGATRWQLFRRISLNTPGLTMTGRLVPSPDGRMLAAARHDFSVRLHDAETGKLKLLLPGEAPITSLAWASEGRWLAAGDGRGRIHFWDAQTGVVRHVLHAAETAITSLAWAPDGRRIAGRLQHSDPPVAIWDVSTGKRAGQLQSLPTAAPRNLGRLLAWSPDGSWLAASWEHNDSNRIHLWSMEQGKPGPTFKDLDGRVDLLLWSLDSREVIAAGAMGVRRFDLDGKVRVLCGGPGQARVTGLAQDPGNGNLMWNESVAGQKEWRTRLWDHSTGKIETIGRPRRDNPPDVAWFRDGIPTGYLSSGFDFRIGPLSGEPPVYRVVDNAIRSGALAWTPDGGGVSAIVGSTIRTWRAQDGKQTLRISTPAGGQLPRAFAWAPDGKRLAVGTIEGLRLYRPWENPDTPLLLDRAKKQIARLVWTSDGKQLIVEGEPESRRLEVWDADRFVRTNLVEGLLEKGQRVSPDGRLVATRDMNKMQLWDLTQKNKILMTVEDTRLTWPPAWTADSRRMALKRGYDVQVLEMPSGKQLTTVPGLGGSQVHAWSSDGRALAGRMSQWFRNRPVVRVWDLEADREMAALLAGTEEVLHGLVWSPQAPLLLGGTEFSLYVWDVKQSRLRWRLVQLMGGKSVVLGEDGHILQADAGAEDELVHVVELLDGSLRLLTPAEFRTQHPPRE